MVKIIRPIHNLIRAQALDYMKNNVTENLWNKVLEKYKPFQEKQKGGPLFFKLMMNQLLSNTESAAKALVERVEK
jgi:hypothetical protein